MVTDRRPARLFCATALLVALAGCAAPSPKPSAPAASQRAETPRPAAQPPAARLEELQSETPLAEEPAIDPIDAILADRRRSDFPEIELQEFGFTITERVRVSGDVRSEYDRALALLRQQRYAEGIRILEGVIEAAPDATVPYIDLGMAYRLNGNAEDAERVLTIAAALSPENPVVHNELGILYRSAGRFAEARSSYERALSVFGDFHYARRNLAVLCDLYLADLDCALRNYTSYLNSVDGDAEVEIWIADIENRIASQGGL